MKNILKILSFAPIFALSACSFYKALSSTEAISRANEILDRQNQGTIAVSAFTYKGVSSVVIDSDDELSESVSHTLVRNYDQPYLYFREVVEYEDQNLLNELWIYKTEGNIIYASSTNNGNDKFYSAYEISTENIFSSLVSESKDITNIDYVEELIFSQETLEKVENFYTRPTPREIYQGFSFVARSKGNGSLDLMSEYAFQEDDTTVAIVEQFNISNYLFTSSSEVNATTFLDEDSDYDSIVIKTNQSIFYKARTTYPDLNQFTLIETN